MYVEVTIGKWELGKEQSLICTLVYSPRSSWHKRKGYNGKTAREHSEKKIIKKVTIPMK